MPLAAFRQCHLACNMDYPVLRRATITKNLQGPHRNGWELEIRVSRRVKKFLGRHLRDWKSTLNIDAEVVAQAGVNEVIVGKRCETCEWWRCNFADVEDAGGFLSEPVRTEKGQCELRAWVG